TDAFRQSLSMRQPSADPARGSARRRAEEPLTMSATLTRRDFIAGVGALVVGFSMGERGADTAWAEGQPAVPSVSLKKAPRLDAWLRISSTGNVTIFSGKAELGQGIGTALMQIAAEELDVRPDRIEIVTADTARTPDESVTSRSHSIIESGNALRA